MYVDSLYDLMRKIEDKDFILLLVEVYPPTQGQLARVWRKRSARLARKNGEKE